MKHQIRTEIIINASSERVFNIITDLDKFEEWNPFIIKSQGTVKKGNRIKNTMKNGDKLFVFKPRLVDVQENRSFEWLGSLFIKGLFDGHHYFHIEKITDHQVKFVQGENFNGILASFILKKIKDTTRNNFIALNQALKIRAEH